VEAPTFLEFDAFAAAIRDISVTGMVQRIEEPRWQLRYRVVGRLGVQHAEERTGLIHTGISRDESLVVLAPLRSSGQSRFNGLPLPTRTVIVLGPRTDLCLSTRGRNEWASVSIPLPVVLECVPRACSAVLAQRGWWTPTLPSAWWDVLRSALRPPGASSPDHPPPPAEDDLLRALAVVLVLACQPAASPVGRPHLSRERIVRLAVMCIERQAGFRIPIDDLARAVGVSRRTLLSMFHEYFGVGPLRYMRLRQLHAIRELLRRRDASTVTSAATQLGVWELGRLARDYLGVFGEHPSETLARARLSLEEPAAVTTAQRMRAASQARPRRRARPALSGPPRG
jgi:AraC family transcriptional regulator, ethanolamine operon transcriptional activator